MLTCPAGPRRVCLRSRYVQLMHPLSIPTFYTPLPTVHFLILSPLLIITIFERIFSVLQKRCEELHIQPRGTRGESGGQTGGDNIQCSTVVYRIAILSGTFDRPAFRIIQKTDVVYAVRVSGRIFINS